MDSRVGLDFPLYVFLDTNIIMKTGFNFNGGALLNLKKYHDAGVILVITNQIIVNEVENNIKHQVKEAASQVKNFIERLYCITELRHSDEYKGLFQDFRKQKWELFIVDQWKNYLKETDCDVLQNADVSLELLLDDYFNGRAPFESRQEKKYEFPDAIVIKSLLKFSEENPISTVIVATEDQGWEKALEHRNNIHTVKQIKDVLSYISKEYKPENVEKTLLCIADGHQRIIEYIERYLRDMNIDFQMDHGDIEDFDIKSIKIAMESIDFIEDEDASVTVLAAVKVVIKYSFFDYENSVYDKEDRCYIYSHEGRVRESHESQLSITVNMKSDESQKRYYIDDIESDGDMVLNEDTCCESERLDSLYEEEPDEWIGEKFYDTCPDCGCKIGHQNDGGNGFCLSCAPNH